MSSSSSRHALWYTHLFPATVPVLLLASAVHLVSLYILFLFFCVFSFPGCRASSSPSSHLPMKNTWTTPHIASQPSRPNWLLSASPENNSVFLQYIPTYLLDISMVRCRLYAFAQLMVSLSVLSVLVAVRATHLNIPDTSPVTVFTVS